QDERISCFGCVFTSSSRDTPFCMCLQNVRKHASQNRYINGKAPLQHPRPNHHHPINMRVPESAYSSICKVGILVLVVLGNSVLKLLLGQASGDGSRRG